MGCTNAFQIRPHLKNQSVGISIPQKARISMELGFLMQTVEEDEKIFEFRSKSEIQLNGFHRK